MNLTLALRPINTQDKEFLSGLYATTRAEEMALVDWSQAEKEAFLRMQFEAQHKFYQEQFIRAQFQIIQIGEEPIGRLYVDRREDEIRLIDIALLPEHRNQGIGGKLLAGLLNEATHAGKPIRIHVETFNPAMRLYQRLGFHPIDDKGVYQFMEWSPNRRCKPSGQ